MSKIGSCKADCNDFQLLRRSQSRPPSLQNLLPSVGFFWSYHTTVYLVEPECFRISEPSKKKINRLIETHRFLSIAYQGLYY